MADTKPKLVSLKRTAKDKRKDAGNGPSIECVAPDYPYGTCLQLEGDELDKIGMKELPKVGTQIPMTILVTVTRVSQSASEREGGEADESRSVSLQITDLAIG
jgi:hypothetical protein